MSAAIILLLCISQFAGLCWLFDHLLSSTEGDLKHSSPLTVNIALVAACSIVGMVIGAPVTLLWLLLSLFMTTDPDWRDGSALVVVSTFLPVVFGFLFGSMETLLLRCHATIRAINDTLFRRMGAGRVPYLNLLATARALLLAVPAIFCVAVLADAAIRVEEDSHCSKLCTNRGFGDGKWAHPFDQVARHGKPTLPVLDVCECVSSEDYVWSYVRME